MLTVNKSSFHTLLQLMNGAVLLGLVYLHLDSEGGGWIIPTFMTVAVIFGIYAILYYQLKPFLILNSDFLIIRRPLRNLKFELSEIQNFEINRRYIVLVTAKKRKKIWTQSCDQKELEDFLAKLSILLEEKG
ncbi:hypothetical protein KFE98_03490 [bacterium SCSIO 12741]|nr:hypothetical protein KFE98_03490 [bacterium SCSIO 12741]